MFPKELASLLKLQRAAIREPFPRIHRPNGAPENLRHHTMQRMKLRRRLRGEDGTSLLLALGFIAFLGVFVASGLVLFLPTRGGFRRPDELEAASYLPEMARPKATLSAPIAPGPPLAPAPARETEAPEPHRKPV